MPKILAAWLPIFVRKMVVFEWPNAADQWRRGDAILNEFKPEHPVSLKKPSIP